MRTFPEADVIWWNASSYYVRCPFCEAVHHHGVNWDTDKLRYSHCGMGSYLCCFPINNQSEVAYEIDKRRGRYTNICVSHDSDSEDEDDVGRLAVELARKATIAAEREEAGVDIEAAAKEVVIIDPGHGIEPSERKAILDPISNCASGDVRAVREYLEASDEAQLFVQGRFSDGKTNLISAAAGPSSAMLSLLIEHGAEVNAVDNNGRSALMEAALFGWVDNHSRWRLAVDFARDHFKNRRERYERAGGKFPPLSNQQLAYIEDTFKRDIDRQEIVRLLSGENRKSKIVFGSPPTLRPPVSYSFKSSPANDSLVLHGPIEEYPICNRWKTVARLERGGKFPSIGAMSGWSHGSMHSLRVDGRQWTDDVFYISEVVGHLLLSNPKDRGKDGQYNACHAEKQLIAYFIDRHVFLPRDRFADFELEGKIEQVEDELKEFLSSTEIGCEVTCLRKRKKDLEYEIFDGDEKLVGKHDVIQALKLELKSVELALARTIACPQARSLLDRESQLEMLNQQLERHTNLIDMAMAPPPTSLAEAVILISSPPCEDCKAFTDKVNKFFGLSIQLFAAL
ncbi:DYW family of nucleic acid deaminases-domain-containing protein [Aspergillus bertholletiae]|uniref:DYW family of nucleic acid deaminases-domain-containing protein n=1 Tax=Aspergillus bertholletiae TaxID=1226010 RepID=A0A5N7AY59_9EURO|nr:DYW family of nucleic acid deaminases-domain-containing protein [Aspergillus bertholletiae]